MTVIIHFYANRLSAYIKRVFGQNPNQGKMEAEYLGKTAFLGKALFPIFGDAARMR
jgi:hypothetical protein